MILGMKERLCSWIEVTAWKIETTSPITRPTSIIGPATSIASVIACVARLTTVSWFTVARLLSVEALDQGAGDQVPAVDQHEQQDLERQRDERRRQHHHAHAHQRRGDDQVDDQERQENQEADLERRLQLGQDEGRDQNVGGNLSARLRRGDLGQRDEQGEVLRLHLTEHELAQRLLRTGDRGRHRYLVVLERVPGVVHHRADRGLHHEQGQKQRDP